MSRTRGPLSLARRAKARLAERLRDQPWFRGVGLVPDADTGLGLRVDVSPDVVPEAGAIPLTFEGLPVQVVRIGVRMPR